MEVDFTIAEAESQWRLEETGKFIFHKKDKPGEH